MKGKSGAEVLVEEDRKLNLRVSGILAVIGDKVVIAGGGTDADCVSHSRDSGFAAASRCGC